MKVIKNTHRWGRDKARMRYAEGGGLSGNRRQAGPEVEPGASGGYGGAGASGRKVTAENLSQKIQSKIISNPMAYETPKAFTPAVKRQLQDVADRSTERMKELHDKFNTIKKPTADDILRITKEKRGGRKK